MRRYIDVVPLVRRGIATRPAETDLSPIEYAVDLVNFSVQDDNLLRHVGSKSEEWSGTATDPIVCLQSFTLHDGTIALVIAAGGKLWVDEIGTAETYDDAGGT